MPQQINTLEIKRMFHEALREVPTLPVIPPQRQSGESSGNGESESEDEDEMSVASMQSISSVISRENMLLGKFVLDPIATDFIGIYMILLHGFKII